MTEQFGDAELLCFVVFHNHECLTARLGELLNFFDAGAQFRTVNRLCQEGERAACKPMLTILFERHHLDRYVTRLRAPLEVREDAPTEHVRHEHVERYRSRFEFACKSQSIDSAHRYENFEIVIPRKIGNHARIMRVVLDNEEDHVSFLNSVAIVFDGFGLPLDGPQRHFSMKPRLCAFNSARGGPWILLRELECEGASLAGGAFQLNCATEQIGTFAATAEHKS